MQKGSDMEQAKPLPSMLTVLSLVNRRPGMYLGIADESPARRLDALEHLIDGYSLAVFQHGVSDRGFDEWAAFPQRLIDRFGWSMSQGPIRAIRHASANDEVAWARLWALLEELTDFKPIAG
jgi:hypothetical protein